MSHAISRSRVICGTTSLYKYQLPRVKLIPNKITGTRIRETSLVFFCDCDCETSQHHQTTPRMWNYIIFFLNSYVTLRIFFFSPKHSQKIIKLFVEILHQLHTKQHLHIEHQEINKMVCAERSIEHPLEWEMTNDMVS